uniref:AGO913 n=1 Tax=Arundo donax TaxID=35708 RepID=A0A0A9GQ82_ARUDO
MVKLMTCLLHLHWLRTQSQ